VGSLAPALFVLALIALLSLFSSGQIPNRQPGSPVPEDEEATAVP